VALSEDVNAVKVLEGAVGLQKEQIGASRVAGCPEWILEKLERETGIEPRRPAWEAGILPLNYSRSFLA
jgi:hypothetical protein